MSRAGEVIENPMAVARAVVRIGAEQTGGELLGVDLYIRPAIEERTLKIIRDSRPPMASYVGVTVEVIVRMENCSLIRYQEREFVVSTDDLLEFEDGESAALAA